MKDPELKSPTEWAERFRDNIKRSESSGWGIEELSTADCRELADRLDDLREALRLLNDEPIPMDAREVRQAWINRVDALLAKYQED